MSAGCIAPQRFRAHHHVATDASVLAAVRRGRDQSKAPASLPQRQRRISIGLLVILATAIDGAADSTTQLLYVVSAGILVLLAALTTATGARTPVIWFRICPFVLGTAAALLLLASAI